MQLITLLIVTKSVFDFTASAWFLDDQFLAFFFEILSKSQHFWKTQPIAFIEIIQQVTQFSSTDYDLTANFICDQSFWHRSIDN